MGRDLGLRVGAATAGLSPAYFAVVMASGSLSLGMRLESRPWLARLLFGVCVLTFATLVCLVLVRLARFPREVIADLTDPGRAFGFFTAVAGADVLAACLIAGGADTAALTLLLAATGLWLVLGYAIPSASLLRRPARTGLARADGSWFVWAVACQSIAVVAASLAGGTGDGRHPLALLAVVAWSVGCFLYAAIVVLVALRVVLFEVTAEDLGPSYWVAMGAASITVLAGARIVGIPDVAVVEVTSDLIAAASVLFWAVATWLVPLLACALCWRHVVRRVPLTYEAAWWCMVFPLGMYAIASMRLGQVGHLPWVAAVGRAELWVAFTAWLVVLTAMCVHLYRRLLAPPRAA